MWKLCYIYTKNVARGDLFVIKSFNFSSEYDINNISNFANCARLVAWS